MLEGPPKVMGNQNECRDEQNSSKSQQTPEFSIPLASGKPGARIGRSALGVLSVSREEGLSLPILPFLLWFLGGHLNR